MGEGVGATRLNNVSVISLPSTAWCSPSLLERIDQHANNKKITVFPWLYGEILEFTLRLLDAAEQANLTKEVFAVACVPRVTNADDIFISADINSVTAQLLSRHRSLRGLWKLVFVAFFSDVLPILSTYGIGKFGAMMVERNDDGRAMTDVARLRFTDVLSSKDGDLEWAYAVVGEKRTLPKLARYAIRLTWPKDGKVNVLQILGENLGVYARIAFRGLEPSKASGINRILEIVRKPGGVEIQTFPRRTIHGAVQEQYGNVKEEGTSHLDGHLILLETRIIGWN